MKTYVAITGTAFLLILLAHVARVAAEGTHLLTQPVFLGTSILSSGLSGWAAWLLWNGRGQRRP